MDEINAPPEGEALTRCYLLEVPGEIRLHIYRYLLLSNPLIDLDHITCRKREKEEAKDSENEWEDEYSDSEDSEMDEVCSACGEHHEDGGSEYNTDSDMEISKSSDSEGYEMHVNIFSVNRQIHNEASALFYAEATLLLDNDAILCLCPLPDRREKSQRAFPLYNIYKTFTVSPNIIWRHNPMKGSGKKEINGNVTYKSAKMSGLFEPHIFFNFQKIRLKAYFDEDLKDGSDMWINDDTLEIRKDHAAAYQAMMKDHPLFKAFTRILSRFRLITHLEIAIDVDVTVTSNAIVLAEEAHDQSDDESDHDLDSLDDNGLSAAGRERAEKYKKADQMECIANEKAAELLVECNLFEPLTKLSNVKNFKFSFEFEYRENEDSEDFVPSPKTGEKIASLRERIEGNFKDPDVA